MIKQSLSDFWEILDETEQLLSEGYNTSANQIPELTWRTPGEAPSAQEEPANVDEFQNNPSADGSGDQQKESGIQRVEFSANNPFRKPITFGLSPEQMNTKADQAAEESREPSANKEPSAKTEERQPIEQPVTEDSLIQVEAQVNNCRACGLCEERNKPLAGEGTEQPVVLIVGGGPSQEDDAFSHVFAGKAGEYLDKWLEAIKLNRRQHCFTTNVLKCRLPENRDVEMSEIESCFPFLERQIRLLKPKAILTVGLIPTRLLMNSSSSSSSSSPGGMDDLHGQRFEFGGIPAVSTYHPANVLHQPELRRPVWSDLQELQKILVESGVEL